MKFFWIGVLLAVMGGGLVGWAVAGRQFDAPTDVFGPFGDTGLSDQQAFARLAQAADVDGGAAVEVVGGEVYDFGVMLREAAASHEFEIRNVGTGPLLLEVAGSTCKCTVGTLKSDRLEPGESTKVLLEWTAKTLTEQFSQSATIKTNDPDQVELQLQVKGNVVDLVAIEPSNWSIGDVSGREPVTVETTIYNHSRAPLEITSAQWLSEDFDARSEVTWERREIDPAAEPLHAAALEAYRVTAVVESGLPMGRLRETLRVRYRQQGLDAGTDTPPVELTLSGRVVGALSLLGSSRLHQFFDGRQELELGETTSAKPLEQKLYLIVRGPQRQNIELEVAEVEPAEALEVELGEPTERGARVLVPLYVRTKMGAPAMARSGQDDDDRGLVVIDSDHPEVAPLRLSVLFQIRES